MVKDKWLGAAGDALRIEIIPGVVLECQRNAVDVDLMLLLTWRNNK